MSAAERTSEQPGPALEPPRFTLRGLLLAMTVMGCLFGAMTALGVVWSMVLVLFLSLALAHVLGNSLGTRLRDRASQQLLPASESERPPAAYRAPPEMSRPAWLAQRVRVNRLALAMGVGGALAGGGLGGSGLADLYPDAGAGALTLGVVSSAVLGALAGFLLSSFLLVVRQAWSEALDDDTLPNAARRRPR